MDLERRFVPSIFELREVDNTEKPTVISGVGVVFNSSSDVLFRARIGKKTIEVREQIDPKAFDSVMATKPDVVALFNHDPNIVMGRTANNTLELRLNEKTLDYEITPPDTQFIKDTVIAPIVRRDVSQSSFQFSIDPNKGESFKEKDGVVMRTILKVDEFRDLGPVTFPAYPATESIVRSLGVIYEDFSEQLEESLEFNSSERKEFADLKEKYKRLLEAHTTLKRIQSI